MSGRRIRLSPARVFIADLSRAARKMPQGVIGRRIDIAELIAARKAAGSRIPFTACFIKAWAEAARELPELRRSYLNIPWPHLYEHEASVASLMVEREIDGAPGLFPARIKNPADRSLAEIAADIGAAIEKPLHEVKRNWTLLWISRLPLPLRRIVWWYGFNTARGRQLAIGTFGVSAVGHLGASIMHPVSPVTTFIGYGPFAADGTVDVTIGFDHRVMDGAVIARALSLLETKLKAMANAL
jgi:pyruvate/2-oxoglutarate dehydrogenase complex dihydrolipoamide acyltransferase (E2) component